MLSDKQNLKMTTIIFDTLKQAKVFWIVIWPKHFLGRLRYLWPMPSLQTTKATTKLSSIIIVAQMTKYCQKLKRKKLLLLKLNT